MEIISGWEAENSDLVLEVQAAHRLAEALRGSVEDDAARADAADRTLAAREQAKMIAGHGAKPLELEDLASALLCSAEEATSARLASDEQEVKLRLSPVEKLLVESLSDADHSSTRTQTHRRLRRHHRRQHPRCSRRRLLLVGARRQLRDGHPGQPPPLGCRRALLLLPQTPLRNLIRTTTVRASDPGLIRAHTSDPSFEARRKSSESKFKASGARRKLGSGARSKPGN